MRKGNAGSGTMNEEQTPNQLNGTELLITRDGKPVARLTSAAPVGVPMPGRGKGKLIILAEDDEHLAGFAECME